MLSATWNIVQSYEFNFSCFCRFSSLTSHGLHCFFHSVYCLSRSDMWRSDHTVYTSHLVLWQNFRFYFSLLYRDLLYVPNYINIHHTMLMVFVFSNTIWFFFKQWTAWTPPAHLTVCVFTESVTAIQVGAATIARSWRLCAQTSAQDTEPTRQKAAPAPVTPTGRGQTALLVLLIFCISCKFFAVTFLRATHFKTTIKL